MTRPFEPPPLESNDVHVWIFSTDVSPARCADFREILSAEERARADRFMFEPDRIRFTASHGELRVRLGHYCRISPEALEFGVGPHGKPFLQESSSPIQFNLSHSGSRGAIAVTPGLRCGVDIEKPRPNVSAQDIAQRFFCARETEWLQSLPENQRIRGFYRIWAAKEAVLKADGKGMAIALSAVDTTSVLKGLSPIVSLPGGTCSLSVWVGELEVADDYASALAVEANAPRVQVFQDKK